MNKMNSEAKAKVVAALRSGEYKQSKNYLKHNDCFCIWGVICDVSNQSEWTPRVEFHAVTDVYRYGNFLFGPIPQVIEWSGIDPSTYLTINGIEQTLMAHNDDGIPFAQLADAIEEQL